MDDFDKERELEDAGIDAFEFSLMNDDERREALEDAGLDPLDYEGAVWTPFVEPQQTPDSVPSTQKPLPASPEISREPESQQPPKIYRYCLVRFTTDGPTYAYQTKDKTISAGDQVIVPAGYTNEPKLVQVVSVGDYAESAAPYPPEKTKSVIRKATEEDISALEKPEPSEASSPVFETDELQKHQRKSHIWIEAGILLAIIAAIAVGTLIAFLRSGSGTEPEAERSQQSESTALPTHTPAPTQTPAPPETEPEAPAQLRIPLSNALTDMYITDWLDSLADVTSYLSAYNEAMWVPEEVFLDHDKIIAYEGAWAGYAADMAELREEMDRYEPAAAYADAWNDLYGYVDAIQRIAAILSDWDSNDDGEYSVQEASDANTLALQLMPEAKSCLDRMSGHYDAAFQAAGQTAAQAPQPTATPRRTTSTPKPTNDSDPYNARDYVDPDDFYYDYYDDFWDYEDAEYYWDEWN